VKLLNRLFLGLVGVGLVVYGVKERQLAAVTGEKPVKMTCKELGEAGKLENANVILTDFVLTPNFVRRGKDDRWTRIWVPVVPVDGEYVRKVKAAGGKSAGVELPRPVQVVVTSDDVRNDKDFEALGSKRELEGLVINEIETMSGNEKELLEKSYGDVSKAQIFAVGRKPTSTALAYGLIAGGVLLGLWVLKSFLPKSKGPGASGNAGGGGGAPAIGATSGSTTNPGAPV